MPHLSASVTAALLAALVTTSPSAASAQDGGSRPRDAAQPKSTQQTAQLRAVGGAVAPYVRVAALIDAGGAVVRSKGVYSVQRISTGVYCVRVANGINPSNSIATVSVDYFYSNFDEATVQTASASSGCPAGQFGVYTFGDPDHDGNYTFNNGVGFSIVVP